MDGVFEVEDIDGLYFKRHLKGFLRKICEDIDSAWFKIYASLKAKDDVLKVNSSVILKELKFSEEIDKDDLKFFLLIISPFKEDSSYRFDFSFTTKLTNFKIDFASIGKAFSKKSKDAFVLLVNKTAISGKKIIEKTVDSTLDILFGIFKEIGDLPEEVFKGESK